MQRKGRRDVINRARENALGRVTEIENITLSLPRCQNQSRITLSEWVVTEGRNPWHRGSCISNAVTCARYTAAGDNERLLINVSQLLQLSNARSGIFSSDCDDFELFVCLQ